LFATARFVVGKRWHGRTDCSAKQEIENATGANASRIKVLAIVEETRLMIDKVHIVVAHHLGRVATDNDRGCLVDANAQ
jgi:hypothetical protein